MCVRAFLLLGFFGEVVVGYTDRGILKLDNTTFDRIVDGSKTVFVRFDKEYSYGDEHDAWKEFAATVGSSSANMLVADVGVSEYGDKDNSDISDRYSIKSEDFPQYRLWLKDSGSPGAPTIYAGEKKADGFLRFVQEKAGVWIGLPGQVKELDTIAKAFVNGDKSALQQAEKAVTAAEAKDSDSAKYYLKVMKKMGEKADFVQKETARLEKMISDGSVKAGKKEQFGRRLNVLSSFRESSE